jgi:hypothetical protein
MAKGLLSFLLPLTVFGVDVILNISCSVESEDVRESIFSTTILPIHV